MILQDEENPLKNPSESCQLLDQDEEDPEDILCDIFVILPMKNDSCLNYYFSNKRCPHEKFPDSKYCYKQKRKIQ